MRDQSEIHLLKIALFQLFSYLTLHGHSNKKYTGWRVL